MTSPSKRLSWFGRAWIAGVVAYALVRAAIVWPTLGDYGVSPLLFLLIDVGTAWPYAYAQVRIVQAIRGGQWAQVQGWGFVALASFLAPYAYIVGAGSGELPLLAYIIVATLVILIGGASVARILRQARPAAPIE